jgi:hypothetical protein
VALKLVDLIERETEATADSIMLLRHGNDSVALLRQHGATVEEFTAIQPIASKYDYFHPDRPPVFVVVVIADDHVYGVLRVMGVEAEGTNYTLASEAYASFDAARGKPELPCRKFLLRRMASTTTGLRVRGWEGRWRIPVQRFGDAFFQEIEVTPAKDLGLRGSVEKSFEAQVAAALRDSAVVRLRRLAEAEHSPRRVPLTSLVFVRNPDVVAEVLYRAVGVCQACRQPAPFARRSDGSPYLEVHHKTPLADGGSDTVGERRRDVPELSSRGTPWLDR